MSDVVDPEAFEVSLRQWRTCGEAVVRRWDDIIDEMTKFSSSRAQNRMFGKVLSAIGGGITAGGIVAAPFTGGVSAAVFTLLGAGVSAVGCIVYNVAAIRDKLKENSTSDNICQMMEDFSATTEGLLEECDARVLRSYKRDLKFALQTVINSIPFATPPGTALATGAFSTVFKENPPTSYFSPDPKEMYKVCGREVPAMYVHTFSAVVCVLLVFASITMDIIAAIDEKRIIDGRVWGNYIRELRYLRDNLKQCLIKGSQASCAHQESMPISSGEQQTSVLALTSIASNIKKEQ